MNEIDLINGLQRAASAGFMETSYDVSDVRALLVDYFRDVGYRNFAEKLELAMQQFSQLECDCGESLE